MQRSQGVSRPANIGKARVRGVELAGEASLKGRLKVAGNYTFQRARDRSGTPYLWNRILPNRPQHEAQATADLKVGRAKLTYILAYQGGSFLDRANLRPVHVGVQVLTENYLP